jgi:double-stranded uracil-DNA glycosylase
MAFAVSDLREILTIKQEQGLHLHKRHRCERGCMNRVQSFPPIASEKSKALILGSMPGGVSLKVGQYYAHPRNAFWRIMGELFGAEPSLPYEVRVLRLQSAGVALWDSIQACARPGSLDTSITDEVVNDFPTFFLQHPAITHVFFNGVKSEAVFRRHALPSLQNRQHILIRLPSSSPAHAGMPFQAKVQAWSVVKEVLS